MEPEPNHSSLPSYCVCVCMLGVAKSQHITLFVSFATISPISFSCILSNLFILQQVLTKRYMLGNFHSESKACAFYDNIEN